MITNRHSRSRGSQALWPAMIAKLGAVALGGFVLTQAIVQLPASGAVKLLDTTLAHELARRDHDSAAPFAVAGVRLTRGGVVGSDWKLDQAPWHTWVTVDHDRNLPTIDGWLPATGLSDTGQTEIRSSQQSANPESKNTGSCADDLGAYSEAELLACPITDPHKAQAEDETDPPTVAPDELRPL